MKLLASLIILVTGFAESYSLSAQTQIFEHLVGRWAWGFEEEVFATYIGQYDSIHVNLCVLKCAQKEEGAWFGYLGAEALPRATLTAVVTYEPHGFRVRENKLGGRNIYYGISNHDGALVSIQFDDANYRIKRDSNSTQLVNEETNEVVYLLEYQEFGFSLVFKGEEEANFNESSPRHYTCNSTFENALYESALLVVDEAGRVVSWSRSGDHHLDEVTSTVGYNPSGQVVSVEVTSGGGFISLELFTYNQEGLLSKRMFSTFGATYVYDYEYYKAE